MSGPPVDKEPEDSSYSSCVAQNLPNLKLSENRVSDCTQPPSDSEELPRSWSAVYTLAGSLYYRHDSAQILTWSHPSKTNVFTKEGWQQAYKNGQIVYVNHNHHSIALKHPDLLVTLNDPRPLPRDWKQALSPTGQFVFFNERTQVTTGLDPRLPRLNQNCLSELTSTLLQEQNGVLTENIPATFPTINEQLLQEQEHVTSNIAEDSAAITNATQFNNNIASIGDVMQEQYGGYGTNPGHGGAQYTNDNASLINANSTVISPENTGNRNFIPDVQNQSNFLNLNFPESSNFLEQNINKTDIIPTPLNTDNCNVNPSHTNVQEQCGVFQEDANNLAQNTPEIAAINAAFARHHISDKNINMDDHRDVFDENLQGGHFIPDNKNVIPPMNFNNQNMQQHNLYPPHFPPNFPADNNNISGVDTNTSGIRHMSQNMADQRETFGANYLQRDGGHLVTSNYQKPSKVTPTKRNTTQNVPMQHQNMSFNQNNHQFIPPNARNFQSMRTSSLDNANRNSSYPFLNLPQQNMPIDAYLHNGHNFAHHNDMNKRRTSSNKTPEQYIPQTRGRKRSYHSQNEYASTPTGRRSKSYNVPSSDYTKYDNQHLHNSPHKNYYNAMPTVQNIPYQHQPRSQSRRNQNSQRQQGGYQTNLPAYQHYSSDHLMHGNNTLYNNQIRQELPRTSPNNANKQQSAKNCTQTSGAYNSMSYTNEPMQQHTNTNQNVNVNAQTNNAYSNILCANKEAPYQVAPVYQQHARNTPSVAPNMSTENIDKEINVAVGNNAAIVNIVNNPEAASKENNNAPVSVSQNEANTAKNQMISRTTKDECSFEEDFNTFHKNRGVNYTTENLMDNIVDLEEEVGLPLGTMYKNMYDEDSSTSTQQNTIVNSAQPNINNTNKLNNSNNANMTGNAEPQSITDMNANTNNNFTVKAKQNNDNDVSTDNVTNTSASDNSTPKNYNDSNDGDPEKEKNIKNILKWLIKDVHLFTISEDQFTNNNKEIDKIVESLENDKDAAMEYQTANTSTFNNLNMPMHANQQNIPYYIPNTATLPQDNLPAMHKKHNNNTVGSYNTTLQYNHNTNNNQSQPAAPYGQSNDNVSSMQTYRDHQTGRSRQQSYKKRNYKQQRTNYPTQQYNFPPNNLIPNKPNSCAVVLHDQYKQQHKNFYQNIPQHSSINSPVVSVDNIKQYLDRIYNALNAFAPDNQNFTTTTTTTDYGNIQRSRYGRSAVSPQQKHYNYQNNRMQSPYHAYNSPSTPHVPGFNQNTFLTQNIQDGTYNVPDYIQTLAGNKLQLSKRKYTRLNEPKVLKRPRKYLPRNVTDIPDSTSQNISKSRRKYTPRNKKSEDAPVNDCINLLRPTGIMKTQQEKTNQNNYYNYNNTNLYHYPPPFIKSEPVDDYSPVVKTEPADSFQIFDTDRSQMLQTKPKGTILPCDNIQKDIVNEDTLSAPEVAANDYNEKQAKLPAFNKTFALNRNTTMQNQEEKRTKDYNNTATEKFASETVPANIPIPKDDVIIEIDDTTPEDTITTQLNHPTPTIVNLIDKDKKSMKKMTNKLINNAPSVAQTASTSSDKGTIPKLILKLNEKKDSKAFKKSSANFIKVVQKETQNASTTEKGTIPKLILKLNSNKKRAEKLTSLPIEIAKTSADKGTIPKVTLKDPRIKITNVLQSTPKEIQTASFIEEIAIDKIQRKPTASDSTSNINDDTKTTPKHNLIECVPRVRSTATDKDTTPKVPQKPRILYTTKDNDADNLIEIDPKNTATSLNKGTTPRPTTLVYKVSANDSKTDDSSDKLIGSAQSNTKNTLGVSTSTVIGTTPNSHEVPLKIFDEDDSDDSDNIPLLSPQFAYQPNAIIEELDRDKFFESIPEELQSPDYGIQSDDIIFNGELDSDFDYIIS